MNQDQIDAGFDQVRSERFLRAHAAEARDPGFWRALSPHLTISPQPWSTSAEPVRVDPAVADRAARQIVTEGYCQMPPLLSTAQIAPLRLGAERVVTSGFPAGFTCVYDEFYRAFQGLDALFAPLLGDWYLLVLRGLWTFLVPAGDTAYRRWTTIAPHRDLLGPDPNVIAHEPPSILSVWIPLTDVTTSDSCLYVVPAPGDPDYHSRDRYVLPERIRLQDIRALPAAAGSVLGWSMHLAHWGSRSSGFAAGPRVSVTVYFQRRDASPAHPSAIELGAPIPFDDRLTEICRSLGVDDPRERAGEQHG